MPWKSKQSSEDEIGTSQTDKKCRLQMGGGGGGILDIYKIKRC